MVLGLHLVNVELGRGLLTVGLLPFLSLEVEVQHGDDWVAFTRYVLVLIYF